MKEWINALIERKQTWKKKTREDMKLLENCPNDKCMDFIFHINLFNISMYLYQCSVCGYVRFHFFFSHVILFLWFSIQFGDRRNRLLIFFFFFRKFIVSRNWIISISISIEFQCDTNRTSANYVSFIKSKNIKLRRLQIQKIHMEMEWIFHSQSVSSKCRWIL